MIKVIYPDGEIEYWTLDKNFVSEYKRLQKIHNNQIKFKII